VSLPLQGSRAHNAAHWVLTNTRVKTSRTLSLPLDTDIPYGHHSIAGDFHSAALILVYDEGATGALCREFRISQGLGTKGFSAGVNRALRRFGDDSAAFIPLAFDQARIVHPDHVRAEYPSKHEHVSCT